MTSGRQQTLFQSSDGSMMLYHDQESENKEEDSSHDSMYSDSALKPRRKMYNKRFREEWLDEPIFAGWLRGIPNTPDRCYCTVCDVVLLAGHSELEKHAAGKKHSNAWAATLAKDSNVALDDLKLHDSDVDLALNRALLGNSDYQSHIPYDVRKDGTLVRSSVKAESPSGQTKLLRGSKNQPAIIRRSQITTVKRKLEPTGPTQPLGKMSLPDRPDAAKLIRLLRSETDDEDEFDDDDDDELDDPLSGSQQLLKEMRNELAFDEKQRILEKQSQAHHDTNGKNREIDEPFAEKELEARLNMIEERRRHQLNIYKLRLLEMEARVKLAEAEARRAEELHQLRVTHLHLQIQREQNQYIVTDIQPEPNAEQPI